VKNLMLLSLLIPTGAALAQDLGYFDQAHFIADFRRLVGCTPGEYARAHGPG